MHFHLFHLFDLLQAAMASASHGGFGLLQGSGIPGLGDGIPGIDKTYLPTQAAIAALKLYEKIFKSCYKLVPFFLLVSFGSAMLFTRYSIQAILARFLLITVLFVSIPYVFGTTIAAGTYLAEKVFDKEDVKELQKEFREAGLKAQNEKGIENDLSKKSFIEQLVGALKTTTAGVISDIVLALVQVLFLFMTIAIFLLWRALVIVLFVLSPILVLFGFIPGLGTRILANWYGSVLQLSFWQPWLAICSWFIRTADDIFSRAVDAKAGGHGSISNHVESAVVSFIMLILILATPFVVAAILPLSRFGSAAGQSVIAGTILAGRTVTGIVTKIIR